MHPTTLSPIQSNDSASSNADYASGQEDELEQVTEERRRLILARSQCRTPSTGSQVSELADETADLNELDNGLRQQQLLLANNARQRPGMTPAKGPTGDALANGGATNLATRYLFHTNNTHPHQYQNNCVNQINSKRRKFGQMIQSIPLPLVATSIITVFILCLLLSECKSLQVSPQSKGPVESLLLAEPLGAAPPPDESGSPTELSGQVEEQRLDVDNQAKGLVESGLFKLEQQLALKRDLINDLMHQRRLRSHQQHENNNQVNAKQRRTIIYPAQTSGRPEQQQQQVDSAQLADTLGAMLFGLGAGEAQAASSDEQRQQIEVYMDGQPSGERIRSRAGSGAGEPANAANEDDGEQNGRPSHLRSSPMELDLSEEQQAPLNQRHRQQHPSSNQNHQNNHHRQQQQQSHSQFKQPNAEDQMQKHYQQLTNNNHDRPFDVAQIQCNNTEEGFERFACPSPDRQGRYRCIEDRLFCDGYYDCPNGEDEERVACMYYKLTPPTDQLSSPIIVVKTLFKLLVLIQILSAAPSK